MSRPPMIPQPPFDSVIDPTVQFWTTGVIGGCAAAALLYALIDWRRSGKPTFLLLFVSGGAMMAFEPLVDTVGACWFPEGNSWVAFYAYGRPIALWLCLCYFFYFGIGVGVTWRLMRAGLTRARLWLLFVAFILGDFVLESTLLHFDAYVYYGWQPLVVLKFPFWWGPVNAIIVMVSAAVVYRFETYLHDGWRRLMMIPIIMSVSAAFNSVAGWPSWFVINTDVGPLLTQVGGLLTFVIAFWIMGMVISQVAENAPARAAAGAAAADRGAALRV